MSNYQPPNNHVSVSSSVYSPTEMGRRFTSTDQLGPLEEEELHADAFSFDGEPENLDVSEKMPTEPSQQTFNSYMTAHGSTPSFSSLNSSLLRTDPRNPDEYYDESTPRLADSATFQDEDKTPIIGSWPVARDEVNKSSIEMTGSPVMDTSSSIYPSGFRTESMAYASASTANVADRFERLSLTLQQNNSKVSHDSHLFQINFTSNVQKVNSSSESANKTRTSAYYKKINSKPSGSPERKPSAASQYSMMSGESSGISVHTTRSHSLNGHDEGNDIPIRGLNISVKEPTADPNITAELEDSHRFSINSEAEITSTDMSILFIRALHSFDSSESKQESDSSVCLSFEKGDVAFVHTIDDSGWGEVTVLETLDRGWVPMNFFSVAVNSNADLDEEDGERALQYARYMTALLDSCGKFLLNPISHTTRNGTNTFSIKIVNSIRDGVRFLLQETDCLSRSNEIVIKRPVVRKCRKSLLSDWYNLMLKANEFRGTSNFDKIEILTLLVLQVIRRATTFFDVWTKESKEVIKRDTEIALRSDMEKYPLLKFPPHAKQRVTEINSILYSYLSMIIGRLDLIEHNPAGCDMLETIVHHVILLLRELLFISKTGSDYISEKPAELDGALDHLLSLVSQIVTSVKGLVIMTLNRAEEPIQLSSGNQTAEYYYTDEGKKLSLIASKMIRWIGVTIHCIRKIFDTIGDFRLSAERSYPDYSRMRIEADVFIKTCSVGIVKSLSLKLKDLRDMKKTNPKTSNRFSMFRSGKQGEHGITANGVNTFHQIFLLDTDSSAPFDTNIKEFEQYLPSSEDDGVAEKFTIQDELLEDENGNLLGASFKGLIYKLTNESSPPEYFFVSTFFICFRKFSSPLDLAEQLIGRFDEPMITDKKSFEDASLEVRMKSRRRLVCKMFQIWMESYWNHEQDNACLNTLINFFNEGVRHVLPLEAIKLIEITARLMDSGPQSEQFVNRNISLSKLNSKKEFIHSIDSPTTLNSRYSMVDGYEIGKINTNSSVTGSLKSLTLPLPLGISGQSTATNSLLTKSQLNAIEALVTTYRKILGEHWCSINCIDTHPFAILDTSILLPRWYALSDQNWVLSNYRPNLLEFNGLEIAKQLTLIESRIFCAIKPSELVDGNYTAKKAHLDLAKNVRHSLLFTNSLSEYVLESILQPGINYKVRVNTVKTWLKIAISCLYLRNFNSLAAIITSLQSHLVTRLHKIWADLSEKYTELYEYLCSIIHPDKNYSVYRNKIRSFLLSNEYEVPVVPYFSLFLQDLTFVTDGNPNYRKANTFLKQKLINIDKYTKLTKVIADIECLQVSYDKGDNSSKSGHLSLIGHNKKRDSISLEDYAIASVPALKELILLELWKISQLNKKEDDRAWKLSCAVQPRDTPQSNEYL